MSRFFDGQFSTESVTFSVGNAPPDQGPITISALARPATTANGTHWIVSGLASTTNVWSILMDTSQLFMENDFGGGPTLTLDNWYWIIATKATGSAQPRWHTKNITTSGAWSHTNDSSSTVGDNTGPITSIIVGNSATAGGNDFRGWIAATAAWASTLTDLQVEAACTLNASDLAAASPNWGALWNQSSVAATVTDFTGGGGNQTAISGTTADTAVDPPGWSYSLSASFVARPPLLNRQAIKRASFF